MNRKSFIAVIMFAVVLCVSGCGRTTDSKKVSETNQPSATKGTENVLVAYFSATGNTETIAKKVGEVTGGDLYRIEPKTTYTSDDLNYNDDTCRANKEMKDASARPEITGSVETIEKYQVIYLGYPIWWGTAPRIMNTFLESYGDSLNGKTIVTFCTSGSSGIATSNEDLKKAYPKINWVDGSRFETDASQSEISEWIATLKL